MCFLSTRGVRLHFNTCVDPSSIPFLKRNMKTSSACPFLHIPSQGPIHVSLNIAYHLFFGGKEI